MGSFCHFHDFGLRSGRRGGGRFFLGILVRRRWGLLRVLVKAVLLELFEIAESAGAAAVRGVEEALDGVPDSVAVAVLEGEGESYRLVVSGHGKPGSVQGDATLSLSDAGAGTLVKYVGEVKAQGAIARLGSRLLGGAAKLMIGQFMKAMEKQVEARS